ncbi:MAG TPA: KUP/HAK/KT family potassium transporter [Gaiellales bacterium]|nr:KUP/HAK/KT family potassium transporter [Gaiellales bacterium]
MKLAFPAMVRPARPPVRTPAPAAADDAEQPHRQDPNTARGLAAAALSLGALGVVYGDIGTSPLYTMQLIFTGDHPMVPSPVRVYGAVSLIFWALMIVVTIKYVLLILRVDNDGEGGIMALVSLIERVIKSRRKTGLVIVGVLGASLFYGDGMLTPAISVVSAVSGLKVASPALASQIVPFSIVILIVLFALQRFGTGAVGGLFGPIMVIWFVVLGILGGREVLIHPGIVRALSPTYAGTFLVDYPKEAFLSLGSVFLGVTGAEAIYADMGHFGRKAITRAWLGICFPALLLNYMGQGALILAHPGTIVNPFFLLVPGGQTGQRAMVVLATVATVIASQAVISGAFSVTRQVIQLGFLPRMTIRHTSQKVFGQIYVPLVNWFLLVAVLGLVLTFRSPTGLANAYGIALSAIFATNTFLAFVVFRSAWRKPLWMVIPGATLFLTVELTFFAANLTKVFHGGWFPLVVGAIFFTILTTWHRGRSELARVMREGRVTVRKFINRMIDERPDRVPGTAVFLTQSLETAPTALLRNVEHNGVLHERVVLLKLETVGVPHVASAHRLRMEQLRLGFLALTARYGYQDEPDVVAVIRLAAAQGADLDPDRVSYFVDHVSILPTGRTRMAGWRKHLFALLYQNSTPVTRYYRIPPDQVFEVGAYVQL